MAAATSTWRSRRLALSGLLVTGVMTVVLAFAGPARAIIPPALEDEGGEEPVNVALVPDRMGTVTPEAPFTWSGPAAVGLNQDFDPDEAGPCGKTPQDYCDITLVNVVPGDFYETGTGGVQFSTTGVAPRSDLDLFVYESDAAGNAGDLVGISGGATADEQISVIDATGYYLVVAVYFDMPNVGYNGRAAFFRRSAGAPPDIDNPAGLEDVLASDPARGFKSHSEPHLAQDPTNSNMLVGGSKMYNLDRDSLAEYEFKIGTYASFNRGRSWFDLGQLNVCPAAEAPPSSWPLGNTCYPADDPALGGTGDEDADDDRRQGDYGEEYITSDVWTDWDDEGNAYAMVLDSPPFESGNGWGMSFHRWTTPSPEDIRSGNTWSRRIPINAYASAAEQATTLDDKNTFAINNAGHDYDGKTGIIVACWGQNYDLQNFGRQAIVCERSVDGGRTWPDLPQAISPPQVPALPFGPFVIGVHVVADRHEPNTFYAVWLDTLTGFLDDTGTSPMWFTKTTDGAKTWRPARIINRITEIPNIFPQEGFRNLSLPIMATGGRGEIYVTYADYNPAPNPAADQDGMQADIKLIRSRDGGATWTAPRRVNQDVSNADQFQPYVRVAPYGQVNVSYFDRRLDVPRGGHPGNFFIDTFLARSENGGQTFREARISHDSWDPTINPPESPSGQFIGDYQGLVADNCWAIPFVNDTHLANDPARDPEFDHGDPRSPFQEIVSWRVPNIRAYGGPRNSGCRVSGASARRGYVDLAGRRKGARKAVSGRLSRRAVARARRLGRQGVAPNLAVIGERSPAAPSQP